MKRMALSITLALVATGCTEPDPEKATTTAQPFDRLKMSDTVYHPSVHIFTTEDSAAGVTHLADRAKALVLGDASLPTCYTGPKGMAQLAVQTEFIPPEYVKYRAKYGADAAFARLDERLDALFTAGLAVHLLLPVHPKPYDSESVQIWQNSSWPQHFAGGWSEAKGGPFVPFKPCANAIENGIECPYDLLFEAFHKPIIEHLVKTGRAEKLAVIYVLNEFGFASDSIIDPGDWGGDSSGLKRAEALAYTTMRALNNARDVAAGKVKVGVKFASTLDVDSGWAPIGNASQLSYILNDVMIPKGDVVGFDSYLGGGTPNQDRFGPFLPMLTGGRFALAEFARQCNQPAPNMTPTTRADIMDNALYWPQARSINLFALNSDPSDCYRLTDPSNIDIAQPWAKEAAKGLWDLVAYATGTSTPSGCPSMPSGGSCTDACAKGKTRCTSGTTMQICADYDSDGCVEWGGDQTCTSGCVAETCAPTSSCGNGTKDPGEACDGLLLGGQSCQSLGFSGGTLSCNNCSFDTSACCDSICSPGVTSCLNADTQQTCVDPDADGCYAWGNDTSCSCINGGCCSYSITSFQCPNYSMASGSGLGGGQIFDVCGAVDANGFVTINVTKFDNTTFGNRPYQVRVSAPGESDCGPNTWYFVESATNPTGIGTKTLTFKFKSIYLPGQIDKNYCVTASTQSGDQGYDPASDQQKSWWWSQKIGLHRSCP